MVKLTDIDVFVLDSSIGELKGWESRECKLRHIEGIKKALETGLSRWEQYKDEYLNNDDWVFEDFKNILESKEENK